MTVAVLTLSSSLFELVPENERASARGRRSVALTGTSWPDVTSEIRDRFPELAERLLTESGSIADGFLVAVNRTPLSSAEPPRELRASDEIHVIAQMAGG